MTAQILEEKDADRKASDEKKDTSELGLEVVDQISAAAGLQAKEKREKKTMTPPRPPSRRGHRPPDLAGSMHVFVLSLYHNMLPGQCDGVTSRSTGSSIILQKYRGIQHRSVEVSAKFVSGITIKLGKTCSVYDTRRVLEWLNLLLVNLVGGGNL